MQIHALAPAAVCAVLIALPALEANATPAAPAGPVATASAKVTNLTIAVVDLNPLDDESAGYHWQDFVWPIAPVESRIAFNLESAAGEVGAFVPMFASRLTEQDFSSGMVTALDNPGANIEALLAINTDAFGVRRDSFVHAAVSGGVTSPFDATLSILPNTELTISFSLLVEVQRDPLAAPGAIYWATAGVSAESPWGSPEWVPDSFNIRETACSGSTTFAWGQHEDCSSFMNADEKSWAASTHTVVIRTGANQITYSRFAAYTEVGYVSNLAAVPDLGTGVAMAGGLALLGLVASRRSTRRPRSASQCSTAASPDQT
jgi:hypothetical protein